MVEILINKKITARGEATVQHEVVDDAIIVSGILMLDRYIDHIESIEWDKYFIGGVEVMKEVFGTSEDMIVYEFNADELEIKSEVQ